LTTAGHDIQHPNSGAVMGRRPSFTSSQIRRAVKAVKDTGLTVKRITIAPDGTISIDSETPSAGTTKCNKEETRLATWEE
jgi:SMC interacting uncharacterized protein involved in chromosome segregation